MSERDERIRELYEGALKRPIGERAVFVAAHSRGDEDLRRRVEALLTGQQDTHVGGYEPGADGHTPVLAAGTLIGHYRIDGPLGAGGMGIVYRATDTKLNRPAAIKVLPESLADPEARRRFQREAQMASSLNHPHIVTVYDAGEYQERQYLITEYVDGGTLRHWAARSRGWLAIVELLIGVADAVAAAHEAGILHRDIKPENILLAKNGYAKLADFGLAKLFEVDSLADDPFAAMPAGGHSTLAGTVGYMSPEQAEGRPLDGRSDVYSFGLVLHELLTGVRPSALRVSGREARPLLAPLPPEVPLELRSIVAKALEENPADRYQTMQDLVVDLRRVVRRSGAEGPSSIHSQTPVPPRVRRRPSYFVSGVLMAAMAVGLMGYYGLDLWTPANRGVAVLPFANESGTDDLHISEGLGDDLRNRLMGVPGLAVQARASSVSFRDADLQPQTVADRLGVGALVNGSFRRRGDTLLVQVEVMDAKGVLLKAWPYEGAERDLLALQQTIAADVTAFLAPGAVSPLPVATPSRENESANRLVMLGTYWEQQVTDEISVDQDLLERAIGYYRQAIAVDPNSVAAHSRLAKLLVYGSDDINQASEHLARARDLGESNPATPAKDLSDVYYTGALFLLRNRSPGIEQAYQNAIRINPDNTDALGAYAQWLMTHHGTYEADRLFRRALERDRQSLSRYVDYAEFLAVVGEMDRVREIGREIEARFPNARGYLRLARLYETTGELDIGIAWGLKAHRADPDNPEALWQVAELLDRIGDFEDAAQLEPEDFYRFYWRGAYRELVAEAGDLMIERPDDLKLQFVLAFGLNAVGSSKTAVRILESAGMPIEPNAEFMTAAEDEALTIYIDALQAVGGREAEASAWATKKRSQDPRLSYTSWWVAAHRSCTLAQLGEIDEAIEALEVIPKVQGLAVTPLIRDSLCFRRLAGDPQVRERYQRVLDSVEARQRQLRERLPATLAEYGVAEVLVAARAAARTSATGLR